MKIEATKTKTKGKRIEFSCRSSRRISRRVSFGEIFVRTTLFFTGLSILFSSIGIRSFKARSKIRDTSSKSIDFLDDRSPAANFSSFSNLKFFRAIFRSLKRFVARRRDIFTSFSICFFRRKNIRFQSLNERFFSSFQENLVIREDTKAFLREHGEQKFLVWPCLYDPQTIFLSILYQTLNYVQKQDRGQSKPDEKR